MSNAVMQQAAISAIRLTGSLVTYITATDVKKSIYASIERDVEVFPGDFETGSATRMTFLDFIKSDVPRIKSGEQILNGNELFTIADIDSDDGIVIRVSVK